MRVVCQCPTHLKLDVASQTESILRCKRASSCAALMDVDVSSLILLTNKAAVLQMQKWIFALGLLLMCDTLAVWPLVPPLSTPKLAW